MQHQEDGEPRNGVCSAHHHFVGVSDVTEPDQSRLDTGQNLSRQSP
jgi:hypothetical protein